MSPAEPYIGLIIRAPFRGPDGHGQRPLLRLRSQRRDCLDVCKARKQGECKVADAAVNRSRAEPARAHRRGQVQGLAHGRAGRRAGDGRTAPGRARRRGRGRCPSPTAATARSTRRSRPGSSAARYGSPGRSVHEVTAAFALRDGTAVVEMAEASGLQRLPDGCLRAAHVVHVRVRRAARWPRSTRARGRSCSASAAAPPPTAAPGCWPRSARASWTRTASRCRPGGGSLRTWPRPTCPASTRASPTSTSSSPATSTTR